MKILFTFDAVVLQMKIFLKYLLVALVFLLPFLSSYGQQLNIDSLKQKMLNEHGESRIITVLTIAKELADKDLQLSIKYGNEALNLAQTEENPELIAHCQQDISNFYYELGKYEKAHELLNNALDYYQKKNNINKLTEVFVSIGFNYSREGKLDSASYYYEKSLSNSKYTSDTLYQIISLRSIGNIYYKQGQFDDALRTFIEGLTLAELNQDYCNEQAKLFNNLGILFSDWGKYSQSLSYYKRALRIMDSLKNQTEVGRIYNNMGTIYWYEGKSDSALIFYNSSLTSREKSGDINGKAFVLNNLGMYYGSEEDYDKSLEYFNKSLQLFESLTNRTGVVMTLFNIGSVYQELKDYKLAKKYFSQSLNIAEAQGFSDYVLANHEALKDIYTATEDWEKAYFALKKYNVINDSIRKAQNIELLSEMEVKFEKEKKQASLNILKNQLEANRIKKNQTHIVIVGILIMLVLIIASTYLLIRQILQKAHVQHDKLTPALLRYQMNPQFINSSLSGIKELIGKNRLKESSMFLSGFAKLIRTFIETSTSQAIVLDKEIETIRSFLKLHQLRYDHQLTFELNIASQVETEMLAIPPFLFFPIFVHIIDYHLSEGKVNTVTNIDTSENYLLLNTKLTYILKSNKAKTDQIEIIKSAESIEHRIKLLNKTLKDKMIFSYQEFTNKNDQEKTIQLFLKLPIKPT